MHFSQLGKRNTFPAKVQEWYWNSVQALFWSVPPKHYENIMAKIVILIEFFLP